MGGGPGESAHFMVRWQLTGMKWESDFGGAYRFAATAQQLHTVQADWRDCRLLDGNRTRIGDADS